MPREKIEHHAVKGVILAGGLGTRLYPLTHATNKHLLPVYDKPMIYYPIQTLVKAGISDIQIVIGGPHAGDFINVLRNGQNFNVRSLSFAYQEHEGGIAQALSLTEDFADGHPVAVILGDNTTDVDIKPEVDKFKDGAVIFLKEVEDPKRFGVPTFDEDGKIIKIEEKPEFPSSNYAVTGLYLYDNHVFDIIRTLRPSERNELEITDVNNEYIKRGAFRWSVLNGFWKDAGTFESLFEVGIYWRKKRLEK